jgi:hypothetical protein
MAETELGLADRAHVFVASRASAATLCAGPETDFRSAWFPRLSGMFVRNSDDPPGGYATRGEAIQAARRYRESCRRIVTNEQ